MTDLQSWSGRVHAEIFLAFIVGLTPESVVPPSRGKRGHEELPGQLSFSESQRLGDL